MKNITLLFLVVLSGSFIVHVNAQSEEHTKEILQKIADRIVKQTPYEFINTETKQTYDNLKGVPFTLDVKVKSRYNDWHYTNGVLDIALMELSETLNTDKYENYVLKNMDFVFNPDNINYFRKQYQEVLKQKNGLDKVSDLSWYMIFRMIRLDDYGVMAASLIDLYQKYKKPAFKKYIDKAAHALIYAEPRLKNGTIARYFPHEMSVWADDLYMSVSLLARMGKLTGNIEYFDDAIHQVLQFHHYLWDPVKGIYYHAYFTDTKQNGVAYWGRCNGWVMMAQADLLSALPEDYPQRDTLIQLFREQVRGVSRYQNANGLWHQLLDKPDSYLETSCSAIFTYCIAKGVNKEWLEPYYGKVARYGWRGLVKNKITADGDVIDICPGTGIGYSTVFYYNRPRRTNLPMGEGPVIRAGAAVLKMKHYRSAPAYTTYHLVKDRSENK